MKFLALIPGIDIRESQARCCGIAGTYGYKVEKYQIGMDVGQELFDFVVAQGADVKLHCLRFRNLSLATGTRHGSAQSPPH